MMATTGLIQPFPPGMITTPQASTSHRAVAVHAPEFDDGTLEARRQSLIRELAALRTRSHRRAALQARLNEVTRRLLELESRIRAAR